MTTATTTTPMCTDFVQFAKPVQARFAEMSQHELYTTEHAERLFDAYLAAFPAGTNPTFRTRSTHDCQTCKQFIRRLGGLVTLADGKVTTVWGGLDLPEPYKTVADKLDTLVRAAPIKTVFRTKERKYGEPYNYDSKTAERYDHFHGAVADRHFAADPETKRGEQEAAFQVLKRGLDEIRVADLDTVISLIEDNGIYRGEEHKPAVLGFMVLARAYKAAGQTDAFVWENVGNKNARFRNTAVGTLFVDLAEGKDLDAAVRAFEAKVAPMNYKRPTAVITQKMVDDALATINRLDLGGAIARRYARLSDVSVNDVLFVDNESKGRMKDGIAVLLEASIKPVTPDLKYATPITPDAFLADVLPKAKTLAVFVQNRHQGNFVSLTGADGPERPFKWPNNFAWSYNGEVADSMKQRVAALGGRVDGPFRFTHSWNHEEWGQNQSLMDLHVFFPGHDTPADGTHERYGSNALRVGWNRRNDSATGGVQDVDHVTAAAPGTVPVENISFPSVDRMPEGTYTLKCHNWQLRGVTKSGFKAEVEAGGQLVQFEHPKPLGHKQWVTVATVTLKKGQFTITPVLPTTITSRDVWGVKTETLVPVVAAMHSPNHWNGSAVGPKHLIFVLKDCKNPGSTRGIYNEMLRSDLEPHRKVFEVLAAKTKVPYADDQLSGVGFTAARGDTVTVVVDGRRAYTLTF